MKSNKLDGKNKDRWQVHRITEDYVNVVGDLMYPPKTYEALGFSNTNSVANTKCGNNLNEKEKSEKNNEKEKHYIPPLSRVNTLGYLLHPLRRKHAIEMWSPYETAVFEASMTLYGKNFHKIQKQVSPQL